MVQLELAKRGARDAASSPGRTLEALAARE